MYRGNRVDHRLSANGWSQMRSMVPAEPGWQQVVTSPLTRCREFAEEVAERYGLPLEIMDPLKEVGFGSWEGRSPDQVRQESPETYAAFYADPVNCRPEGAEPLPEFFRRSVSAVETLVEQCPGQRLLVVTHAGVIRAIATWVMNAPVASMYRLKIDYAGLCRVRFVDRDVRLEKFNSGEALK